MGKGRGRRPRSNFTDYPEKINLPPPKKKQLSGQETGRLVPLRLAEGPSVYLPVDASLALGPGAAGGNRPNMMHGTRVEGGARRKGLSAQMCGN